MCVSEDVSIFGDWRFQQGSTSPFVQPWRKQDLIFLSMGHSVSDSFIYWFRKHAEGPLYVKYYFGGWGYKEGRHELELQFWLKLCAWGEGYFCFPATHTGRREQTLTWFLTAQGCIPRMILCLKKCLPEKAGTFPNMEKQVPYLPSSL